MLTEFGVNDDSHEEQTDFVNCCTFIDESSMFGSNDSPHALDIEYDATIFRSFYDIDDNDANTKLRNYLMLVLGFVFNQFNLFCEFVNTVQMLLQMVLYII